MGDICLVQPRQKGSGALCLLVRQLVLLPGPTWMCSFRRCQSLGGRAFWTDPAKGTWFDNVLLTKHLRDVSVQQVVEVATSFSEALLKSKVHKVCAMPQGPRVLLSRTGAPHRSLAVTCSWSLHPPKEWKDSHRRVHECSRPCSDRYFLSHVRNLRLLRTQEVGSFEMATFPPKMVLIPRGQGFQIKSVPKSHAKEMLEPQSPSPLFRVCLARLRWKPDTCIFKKKKKKNIL